VEVEVVFAAVRSSHALAAAPRAVRAEASDAGAWKEF